MKDGREDTIAAISTPIGAGGGIGIIRISGKEAVQSANQIFRGKQKRAAGENTVARMSSHTLKYGSIIDPKTHELIDECLISVMKAPHSYTKEDVVEINCHGGTAVLRKILGLLFQMGVRPAEPGEFTKRAFLNGRIDLSKAEAVMDIISAKTDAARKVAAEQLSGRLYQEITKIREKLKLCLAEIEVALDYPEYELDEDTGSEAMCLLQETKEILQKLSATFYRGRIVKEGVKVTIAGIPNAGKSSLLNLFSGQERAIVTEIPGTTRDTIEELIDLDGIPILLTDTAGLRETSDTVEKIGVDRSYNAIEKSELILFIADISTPGQARRSKELLRKIQAAEKNDKLIVVLNKSDIEDPEAASLFGTYDVKISVKENLGMEALFDKIKEHLNFGADRDPEGAVLTNERHKIKIDSALDALEKAEKSYERKMPLDCISYDIWECGKFLGEITGESIEDDVMETIFSKFCLGK